MEAIDTGRQRFIMPKPSQLNLKGWAISFFVPKKGCCSGHVDNVRSPRPFSKVDVIGSPVILEFMPLYLREVFCCFFSESRYSPLFRRRLRGLPSEAQTISLQPKSDLGKLDFSGGGRKEGKNRLCPVRRAFEKTV